MKLYSVELFILYILSVGHGNSQGERTYIETFNTYVEDVVGHIGDMKAQYPDVPSMLMGHSMVSYC